MKKLFTIILAAVTSMGFVRVVFVAAGITGVEIATAQLSPKTVLMVKPDGTGFYLSSIYVAPVDSNTWLMTYAHAQSSINTINASIDLKYNASNPSGYINDTSALHNQIAANSSAIGTNTTNIATNTSAISTANSNIALKLNKTDTAAMLSPYSRTAIANNTYATISNLALKVNIADTGTMLSPYSRTAVANNLYQSALGFTPVTNARTISTTSPLTGGGDLSANRTFAINNAVADNSTKGAATFDSSYFDATSGLINFAVTSGTGSISSNAITINQPKGKITYASPSIAGAGTVSVTFTNSFITATSIINIGLNGNGSNLTLVSAYIKSQTAGSCVINIQNLSLLSLFNTGFIIDFFIVN